MINYQNIKKNLTDFKNKNNQLEIYKRKIPLNSELFFKKLYKSLNSIIGFVSKNKAEKDIHKLLNDKIPSNVIFDPFYNTWLKDMSNICKIFCTFLEEDKISFWIGAQRGCKRYHVDMVPYRLLVTYAGQGTELLPNHAANRNAFAEGKPNEDIIKNKSALKFINEWDIAVFRGGDDGILHRTPDSALEDSSSILMRLDNKSFLKNINKINGIT